MRNLTFCHGQSGVFARDAAKPCKDLKNTCSLSIFTQTFPAKTCEIRPEIDFWTETLFGMRNSQFGIRDFRAGIRKCVSGIREKNDAKIANFAYFEVFRSL